MTPAEFRRLYGVRVDAVITTPLGGIGPVPDPLPPEAIAKATGIPQPPEAHR